MATATAKREKSPGLAALLIGMKAKPKGSGDDEEDTAPADDEDEEEGVLDPDFEEAAVEAFPELEGERKRLLGFQEAIRAAAKGA